MDGKIGPNAPLANLMARVLRPVRSGIHDKINTEIISTEEALYHIQEFNNNNVASEFNQRTQPSRGCRVPNIQINDIQVGSMDVTGLYPNCKVQNTIIKIEESINNCGLVFNQINREFLTKFVSVLTKGVIPDKNLQNFLQVPKFRTTLNSFLTRQEENQFQGPPINNPGDLSHVQVRSLLAIAASRSTKVVMENHYYQIGGKIYRQKEGSAIGVDLSVESCSLYMTNWDKMFLDKLKRLCITVNLYFRYVDDIVIGLRGIHHGWYYSTLLKKMIFDADRVPVLPGDQHTFFQLQLIANSLDSDIQLTVDTPSQNESGQLPVLDLGLSVVNNKICHTFYSSLSSNYN